MTIRVSTPFCWSVSSLDELRSASLVLRSRALCTSSELYENQGSVSVARAVDNYLNSVLPDGNPSQTLPDENGKFIIFIRILTPLARDRSKRLASLDDAANHKPLLVTVLMPDFAFNLSEIESAYEFTIQESLEGEFSSSTTEASEFHQHLVMHQGTPYLDIGTTFEVLSREHPALLVSLAYSVVFPDRTRHTLQVREVLRSLEEALRSISACISKQVLEGRDLTEPSDIYGWITSLFSESIQMIKKVILPDEDEELSDDHRKGNSSSHFSRHILSETFDSLLTEEREVLISIIQETEDEIIEAGQSGSMIAEDDDTKMEVDQGSTVSAEAVLLQHDLAEEGPTDTIRSTMIEGLCRLEKVAQRAATRLLSLRRAIP